MGHDIKSNDIPFQFIDEEILADAGMHGDFNPFDTKDKLDVCIFDIKLGSVSQDLQGDSDTEEEDYEKVPQWNRFFSGREVVIAKWEDKKIIKCPLVDVYEEQIVSRTGQVVLSTSEKTMTIYISKEEYEGLSGLTFKLFMIPKITGKVLFFPERIAYKRDQENNIKYIEIQLTEINDRLNVLKDERRKQYIQFGAPNEDYVIPKWNKDTDKVEEENVIVEQAHSFQIDFFGAYMLSGIAFYDAYNEDKLLVIKDPLEPEVSDLYRTQTLNQPMTYITGAGLEYQGQWPDWQTNMKDKFDLQVRPKYEGVMTFDKRFFSTGQIIDKPATQYKIKVADSTRSTTFPNQFLVSNLKVSSRPEGLDIGNEFLTDAAHIITSFSDETNIRNRKARIFTTYVEAKKVLDAISLIGENTFSIFSDQVITKIGNTSPLYSNEEFNFSYNFLTPNLNKNVGYSNSADFLAYNSLANFDTIRQPIEITENVPIDFSTIPFFGRIFFGIPVGIRDEINRTSTGYYDRKYNFLIPKTLQLMLSEGIYGEGDNRISMEAFKEGQDNQLFDNKSMAFGVRGTMRYITKDTGDLGTTDYFNETGYTKKPIEKMVLTGLGLCDCRIRFFNQAGKSIWSAFFRQQSQHTNTLIDWTTILSFV